MRNRTAFFFPHAVFAWDKRSKQWEISCYLDFVSVKGTTDMLYTMVRSILSGPELGYVKIEFQHKLSDMKQREYWKGKDRQIEEYKPNEHAEIGFSFKRPVDLLEYAVFRWIEMLNDWDQTAYLTTSPEDRLLRDYLKALLSDPREARYVAVENRGRRSGPVVDYWKLVNGEVQTFKPKSR